MVKSNKFFIQGITCKNCVEKVTTLLQKKLNAENITFSKNNTQIGFDTHIKINSSKLNELLSVIGNYRVNEISDNKTAENNLENTAENVSYKPIYLLLGYLLAANILISFNDFHIEMFMMEFMINFMASFFLVFSFFKLLDLKGFADGYSSYDLIAKKNYRYGYIYPFIELAFGIGYLLFGDNIYLNVAVFIVMLISSVGVVKAKMSKKKFYCACVGTFLKVPLGSVAIIEDITMVVMSLLMIVVLI